MKKWLLFMLIISPINLFAGGEQGVQSLKVDEETEDIQRRLNRLSQNFIPWAGGDDVFYIDRRDKEVEISTALISKDIHISSRVIASYSVYMATAGGNTGVGTNNPTAKFEVQGASATIKALLVNGGNSTGNIFEAQDGGSAVMVVADGGNVGIGDSGPGKKLVVNGTLSASVIEATNTIQAGTQFYAPNGSAGTPGYAWPGDGKNEGFYWNNNTIQFAASGVQQMEVGNGGIVFYNHSQYSPGGTINIGDATFYIGDLSYKTLTDRGCLGWFDGGVELRDGSIVTDVEAIKAIQKHPSNITIYGVPMLDYRTFPKAAYKAADTNGVLLPRDANDEPIGGVDGIEMTSMFSIMIGAIKELSATNDALTKRIEILEAR